MIHTSDLTAAEKRLWDAFPEGREVDYRVGDPGEDDPARGPAWGPERVVRAEVIRALLLGARKTAAGEIAAVRVVGARIEGVLDLDNAEFRHPVRVVECSIGGQLTFSNAKTRRIDLAGSHLPSMHASGAVIDGSLRMSRCRVTGDVQLVGTRIAGALLLEGAMLLALGGDALRANRLRVDDDLRMTDGFTADGILALRGALIGGHFTLDKAILRAPGAMALYASRIEVRGHLSCREVTVRGQIRLVGAQIAGDVVLAGAELVNPDGEVLRANRAQIGGRLRCVDGFRADGAVRLDGARVGGSVCFTGAELTGTAPAILEATGIDVGVHFDCLGGFRCAGRIRLSGSRIGGVINFDDAVITPGAGTPAEKALVVLRHLDASEISLRTARPLAGAVALEHSRVRMLTDSPDSWPADIRLNGFVYDKLLTPGPVEQRIAWLGRDRTGYQPQPYEQLASVYRRMGHDGDARRVLHAKERARRRTLSPASRIVGAVQDAAVGYGYRPARALGWLVVLLTIGTIVFAAHHPRPTGTAPGLPFNPFIYSLDLLLPVINFGQSKAFAATGGYQWAAYLLTAAGWILSATIAAGLARIVNRS